MKVNSIIRGDCLEVMKEMEDSSIDLILTDPPYGMDYQSSWRTEKFDKISDDNNLDWIPEFLKESYRILKNNTHIYIFCNEYSIGQWRKELKEAGFTIKRMLVWVKNNHTSGDLEGDYANKTEYIMFAHKGRRKLNGSRSNNVWNVDRAVCENHPTVKPIPLLMFLIEKSSEEGDLILDPFAGSGTTGRACKDLHRNFILIEKEPKYVEVCKLRLQQQSLF